jgi:serine/threonine protein kinase/Tol biopolymer transport system component
LFDKMSLAAGTRLGPYEILAAIGAGGMGEVYRARDSKLNREVAIKVLPVAFANDSDRMARFAREAQVLASLNHPHIAAIYGLEESDGMRALVMELVEGPTLDERMGGRAMALEETLPIVKQIAEALEYAHEKGIIHRDLKPANVKLTADGHVKVLDFGLAKAVEDPSSSSDPTNSPTLTISPTRAGLIMGTAAYMSPEQAKGRPADRRADIWAFGVVLYELLTGKQLFTGDSAGEILASVLKEEPKLDALPASVLPIVERCLRKDFKKRWQAIGDVRIAMEEAGTEAPQRTKAHATKLAWGVAAVFAVAALVVSILHFREALPPEHTLRYTIPAPENSRLHSFAISPNGRYVTIAAAVQGKRQQLWLRALDTMQAQELPGTEDAAYPFWSPDSRFIGFFAQGKLKKIAASGGPAQSLCDVPDGRGGSWGSIAGSGEDVIVFSPGGGNQFAIQQVPAAGGVPADVSKTKGSYFFPIFLPGGRHFLYLVSGATPFFGDIYLGSLDSNENRRVLAGVSQVVFAPSAAGSSTGHLLFVRQNTLMAQPFDARRAQTSGNAVPIAESVSVPAGGASLIMMTVSENGVLVYRTTEGEAGLNQIVWFDRTGKRLGSVGAPGNVRTPSISPDEKKVAFTRLTSSGTADLWLWDLIRGTDTRLTSDSSFNVGPSWAPDGKHIVFRSNRGGSAGDLYQASASGSGQAELLLATPRGKVDSEWSRDGRFIVYSESDPKTKFDLWILPVGDDAPAGRKPMPFLQTDYSELQGQISPNGHWMAYSSDESGSREVYVRPFPAAEGKWRISIAGGIQPRWRGDSRELFFVGADGKMNAVTVKAVSGTKPSFEASAPLPLFDAHIVDIPVAFEYDVTADGKRFLVTTNNFAGYAPTLNVVLNWNAALKK